jgi:hypothetical protein
MTIAHLDALTAHPSSEPGALLDQCDLHRGVFAREVEGCGESGDTSAEDDDVVIMVVTRHSGSVADTVEYERARL